MARTTTSAERLLTLFRDNVRRVHARGLSHMKIEDERLEAGLITLDGRRIHNFGDCSYLGLGTDPRLVAAAKDALDRFGTSYSSSIGYTAVPLYTDLKERLEALMGAAVAIAPTTTLAHAGALPVLVRPADTVLMDSAVHNSVQMSAQLLRANGVPVATVPHGDDETLERMLDEAMETSDGAVWYLADGVYSMSGSVAPFARIVTQLERHPRLWAYVDDAHGFSWAGSHGSGVAVAEMGWHDRLVISAGLSKGFAGGGGIVANPDPELMEYVQVCGPPMNFGGPIPPAALGANVASADIHLSPEIDHLQAGVTARIDRVLDLTAELRIPMVARDRTPIFFVEVGRTDVMIEVGSAMVADGFYLNPSAWPVVPHRRAGLRFTVTNSLEIDVIEMMLERLHHHLKVAGALERLVVDLRGDEPAIELR
ncbi:MAG TPA: aminotransferase class I/II-fold pyridoxal phosphate-dependent enzyme [Acidimicrobiia bacterium]|nr:aminotransferase class I/II-fold pyridoxal phosphate-dependent enzyme [Acidimicrobiia bacterium]